MTVLDRAVAYAAEKHSGQKRKMSGVPYILHPMEVASIIGTMTNDVDLMAAAVLHDTIEDCGVDPLELTELFGKHVSGLVQADSEDRTSPLSEEASWMERKSDSLLMLQMASIEGKMMWLADKLANMRSFAREHRREGDAVWSHTHQPDPKVQEWYYRTVAEYTTELSDTDAYIEYCGLLDKVFGKEEK